MTELIANNLTFPQLPSAERFVAVADSASVLVGGSAIRFAEASEYRSVGDGHVPSSATLAIVRVTVRGYSIRNHADMRVCEKKTAQEAMRAVGDVICERLPLSQTCSYLLKPSVFCALYAGIQVQLTAQAIISPLSQVGASSTPP